jgi:hypothetical protein
MTYAVVQKFTYVTTLLTTTVFLYAPITVFSHFLYTTVKTVLRIRDPTFFHPVSRIRIFSIPDPGSKLFPSRIPDPHQRI